MAGKTKTTGTTEAVSGIHKNRSLDFQSEFPDLHLVIVSRSHKMHNGYTTQYDYFKGEGFDELKQLPHPDKVLMGESWDNYRARKQVGLDLHRANARSGAKQVTEGPDVETVSVTTQYGGEG
jgi:hypothetical protein